ncbi:MAG: VWA domain-containing protein [Hyphomicrobiaceae bacterium]
MPRVCPSITGIVAAAIAWLAVALTLPARAAEPPTVMVIFDGSGSMWGKLDGERVSKLVMARDALRKGLAGVAPGTRVGLMSFGHRRGGDCQDTETLIEPTPLDLERVTASLEKLNPRGRGPLTRALRETASRLGPATARSTIVLIHDGPDNCQLDPCTVVGDLHVAHPGVRINVVSIGLSPDEAQTMACLPRSTGGRHYQVSSMEALEAALVGALAPVPDAVAGASQPRPAEPEPRAAATAESVAAGRPGLQLWTTLVKGGPALALPVHWAVRKAGDKGAPLWEGETAAPLLILPSGRYDIAARAGLIEKSVVAEAVDGQPRSASLVLDGGLLALAHTQKAEAMLRDAIVTLVRLEARGPGEPRILRNLTSEIAVPAGNYLLSVTEGTLRIERPVGIVAGERVSLANALSLGALDLSAVAARDKPVTDGLVYVVYEDDPDSPQGRREVARSAAPAPRFKLAAGTYYVTARRGLAETRDRVSVRAGEVERRTMSLDAGQAVISVRLAGGRLDGESVITHRLERTDVQAAEVAHARGITASLDLPAGQYRLETRVGAGNVRAVRDIRVRPGEIERIAIEQAAGAVRFRMLDKASAKPLPDIAFEVRDRNGQPVWSGLGAEPRALLLAGRYTVHADGRGQAAERAFEVAPGEERAVEIAPK